MKHQAVSRIHLQLKAAVAAHRVCDIYQQRMRNGVAGIAQQDVDDALGVMSSGASIPQPKRGEPICVNVLGCALEFSERCD